MFTGSITSRETPAGRFSPGIRLKLLGFLMPLVCLIILSVAIAVTKITEDAFRKDLLQRGVAISRMVALSAGYSLLSGDRLAMDSLTAETKNSTKDIEFVSIRGTDGIVLAHSRIEERGREHSPPGRIAPLGTFRETRADSVIRQGKEVIEFTTPILFAGKQVGTVALALTEESLAAGQRSLRRSIAVGASALLAMALMGTMVLSSLITRPVKNLSRGVNELASGAPFTSIPASSGDELGELTRNFNRMAETITEQKDRLSRYAGELEEAYISMVHLLAASIDARDPYTLGHSTRVAHLSRELGKRFGFSGEELDHLDKACLFHDIGKLGMSDEILLKENALSPLEAREMRRHPEDGAGILEKAPSLRRYVEVVRAHHEWYNGKGYPEGRRDAQIPIHAQIISIADAFDAMTTTRPYRKALTPEAAVAEIRRYRGTQFSPELTDAFIRMVEETRPTETEAWQGTPA